ncbi:MAG: hypothetical protein Tsb0034_03510 [Ekhidna sp.]
MGATIKLYAQDQELYRRATDLYYQGRYEQALLLLDSAIALNSDDISRFFYRSKINEALGSHEEAIADLTMCINKSDNDATYLNLRALNYEKVGNESLAFRDYSESIRLRPSWDAHFRRGMLQVKQSQLKKALEDFNASIRLNTNQAEPLRARGYLKHHMGDTEGACEDILTLLDWGYDDVKDWLRKNCG